MKNEPATESAESQSELHKAIAAHPFCQGLAPEQLLSLTENAMLINFAENERLFAEGEMANRFYLIRHGKIALESHARDEAPFLIQYIGAGDVVGWSWLFPPYYWHFDARAVEPTSAIFFYGTRLREQCEENPKLGYELMKRMSEVVIERLQSTRKQLLKLHRGG